MGPDALGVGIDLLEIDRLERALERRPRLAERLFTEAERAYAASRAGPASTWPRGSAPRSRWPRRWACPPGAFLTSRWWTRRRRPRCACTGTVAERAAALGVRVMRVDDPHAPGRRRRGACRPALGRGSGYAPSVTLPTWLDPLLDAAQQRALDAVGDRRAGHSRSGADGAGGRRAGRAGARSRPDRRGGGRVRQGQQRRRWLRLRSPGCASGAGCRRSCCWASRPRSCRAMPGPTTSGWPGSRPAAFSPER